MGAASCATDACPAAGAAGEGEEGRAVSITGNFSRAGYQSREGGRHGDYKVNSYNVQLAIIGFGATGSGECVGLSECCFPVPVPVSIREETEGEANTTREARVRDMSSVCSPGKLRLDLTPDVSCQVALSDAPPHHCRVTDALDAVSGVWSDLIDKPDPAEGRAWAV